MLLYMVIPFKDTIYVALYGNTLKILFMLLYMVIP